MASKNRHCLYCEHTVLSASYVVYDTLEGSPTLGSKHQYLRCDKCGALQLVNIPQDTSQLYPKEYFSFKQSEFLPPEKLALARVLLEDYGFTENDAILDYGCSNLDLLKGLHFYGVGNDDASNLIGYDPYAPQEYTSKEGIRLTTTPPKGLKFDFIHHSHVIEHTTNPREMMEQLCALLRPRGKILMYFPNADAGIIPIFNGQTPELDAPRHITVPTPTAIKLAATAAGLRTIDENHIGLSYSILKAFQVHPTYSIAYSKIKLETLQSHTAGMAATFNVMHKGSAVEIILTKA